MGSGSKKSFIVLEKPTFERFVAQLIKILKAEEFKRMEEVQKYNALIEELVKEYKKVREIF